MINAWWAMASGIIGFFIGIGVGYKLARDGDGQLSREIRGHLSTAEKELRIAMWLSSDERRKA